MTIDESVESDPIAQRLRATLEGTFVIERELRGGMSRVFVAYDATLRRRVAIKVLSAELSAALSIQRFKREILVAASLQHPHIVPVLSAGELGDLPYFVMPYVDGESLRRRLARGPLSIRETVSVMRDVARALEHAHQRGIVHRDIKPDNVILSAGSATVTDFGVSKALAAARAHTRPKEPRDGPSVMGSTITTAGIAIGTPAYMAPEQAAGDPGVDHRADIYSLGVMGYEMLTGAPPFHGRSAAALMTAQLTETPSPVESRRSDITPALADLIGRCLRKDPAARYRSAADLARALDAPEVTSGRFQAPTWGTRIRARKTSLGLIVAAVVVIAGAVLLSPRVRAMVVARTASTQAPVTVVLDDFSGKANHADSALASGVTDLLVRGLTRRPGTRVLTSGVADTAYHVEGAIQRDCAAVRLTLRLVDATGAAKWSDVYETKEKSAFAAQGSLASHALTDLVAALGPASPGSPR